MATHGLEIEMEQMVEERDRFYAELRAKHPEVFTDMVGLPLSDIHPDPVKAFPHMLSSLVKMLHDKNYEPSGLAGVKRRKAPLDLLNPLSAFSTEQQLAAAKNVIERLCDELAKYQDMAEFEL